MREAFAKIGITCRDNLMPFLKQFLKFGMIGVSNTVISWVVYYAILFIDERFYLLGVFLGWLIAVANSFYWNNKYVFKGEGKILHMLLKTYVSYGVSFVMGFLITTILVEWFGISKFIIPPIKMIITIPLNFLLCKLWAYRTH